MGVAIQATFFVGPLCACSGADRAVATASREIALAGLAIDDDPALDTAVGLLRAAVCIGAPTVDTVVTVAERPGSPTGCIDAAATVAVAPASAPMSHRLNHGRHPLDNCARVPKRATCRKPGSVTPAGSSRSGASCET
jgi:hypothetical protein